MKWIAIIINVILIIVVGYLVSIKGLPDTADDVFIVIVFFAAPITSLFALTLKDGDSWIGLYFKRKALEEKQKIAKLDSK